MRTHIGHYEIVSELGRGGMGVVYKAYEPALTRYVAIKELSPALAHDQTLVERFLREARSMASLNDPHIIQIYFIGQDNNQPFFVMEFVDGESLSAIIKREGRLYVGDALKILHQSAKGLSVAHDRGVIHRDIKPGNLMLNQRGQIKIADFGIALANHDFNSKLTGTGEFVGTPGYLSPEVCLGKMVDQRSDIFALGIVLFETLTGRTPFSDESPLKLMLDVVQSEIPDVREINREVDQEVASILKRMLEKDPNDRYQNTNALIEDLEKHYLISQGGTLRLKTLPPVGAASTVIGISTAAKANAARAPTPPPNISKPASVSVGPPPLLGPRTPPPVVSAPPAVTGPGLTQIRPMTSKSNSGGKTLLLLGFALAGMLLMGGAWAVWRVFLSGETAMVTADAGDKNSIETTDADSTATISTSVGTLSDPAIPESPLDALAPTDAQGTGTAGVPSADQADVQAQTYTQTPGGSPEPRIVEPPINRTVVQTQASQMAAQQIDETRNQIEASTLPEKHTSSGSKGMTIAVITNGDPALMIPAQQILEDKLQEEGFDVVDSPQNATFVLRVKSDRIGSQELSFYGQTAIVTTAYLSVKMIGPGGRAIGPTMREKIDYTPLNAEDKVQQAFDGGLGNMRQATIR
jgi:eukaryotic-like serine/threonine-protein kinase